MARVRLGRWGVLAAVCLLACAGRSQTVGERASDAAAPVSPALDERIDCTPVPGTRVCLEAPPGHEPGQGFDGYQWPATGSSLFILEFPAPQSEMAKAFAVPGPVGDGMTVLHSKSVRACGGQAQLVQLSQTASGTLFHKWILICGDEHTTILLNAVYPASAEDQLSEPFRAALLSAVWDSSLVIDPLAKLDWSIEPPPQLELAHETGGMLMYTQVGVVEQEDAGAPVFVIAPSMGTVAIEDLRASAEAGVHRLAETHSLEITSSRATTIASFDAWEIVGQARDSKSDRPLAIYQMMIVRGDGYILIVGIVDAYAAPDWLERFRTAASSWRPKD